jgi:hypothetical protein
VDIKVDTRDLERARQLVGRSAERFRVRLDQLLRSVAIVEKNRIKRLSPVGVTRTLRARTTAFRIGPLWHRVASGVGYASYVERGRERGGSQPPIEALIPWVRRHGIARSLMAAYRAAHPKAFSRVRLGIARTEFRFRRVSRGDVIGRFERAGAFLVGRAIKRRGIAPRYMFLRAGLAARVALRNGVRSLLGRFFQGGAA